MRGIYTVERNTHRVQQFGFGACLQLTHGGLGRMNRVVVEQPREERPSSLARRVSNRRQAAVSRR